MPSYHDEIWASVPEQRPFNARVAAWAIEASGASDGPRLLDLGCGDGRLASSLASAGATVTGIDRSRIALDRARRTYPELTLAEVNADGTLPSGDASFDAAVCINVLEHVADTQRLLSELRRVLVPRARAAIAVPRNSWLRMVLRGPRAFERVHDPLEPVLRFYTSSTLASLLAQFGFETVKVNRSGSLLLASTRRG